MPLLKLGTWSWLLFHCADGCFIIPLQIPWGILLEDEDDYSEFYKP